MEFIDLKRQQNRIKFKIDESIQKVLEHGKYILGPEVFELEDELSKFVKSTHCITCSSGTDALLMSLMALRVGKGDAIFTSPFTFIASADVISFLGATPFFVDIDESSFNIDPKKIEPKNNEVVKMGNLIPKAILCVDMLGLPADYISIEKITKKNGLFLIEDAAQSFGASIGIRKACSFGDLACTSFFPAKPLGCYGDGGAIFTNNGEIAQKLISIRSHGQGKHKNDNVIQGINGRMDTIQASILKVKLSIFEDELKKRNLIAEKYTVRLKEKFLIPKSPNGFQTSWAQYSILTENRNQRDKIQRELMQKGIPTSIYYPMPLHLQKMFWDLGYKKGDFPVAEDISSKILSLPMSPYLNDEEIDFVCNALINGNF